MKQMIRERIFNTIMVWTRKVLYFVFHRKYLDYDARVYIDDNAIIAEDRFGNVISTGVAGKDDVEVTQSVINSLSNGGIISIEGEILFSSLDQER